MLSVADLLDGADATDAGIARVFERVRDIPLLGIKHRTGFPRAVVRELNAWLEKRRAHNHARGAGMPTR